MRRCTEPLDEKGYCWAITISSRQQRAHAEDGHAWFDEAQLGHWPNAQTTVGCNHQGHGTLPEVANALPDKSFEDPLFSDSGVSNRLLCNLVW